MEKNGLNQTKAYKIDFILLCGLFTGFLWRLRGDHGWGGFAGMCAVTLGLLLVIFSYYPYRKKINTDILPLIIFMAAITNSGYGTLNSQITGILQSGTDAPAVYINPFSGIITMFLVGFGWAPFLAMFIGYYLSDKKPRFYHYIIAVVIFYAVQYAAKATVSHLVVKLISPESVSAFAETLTSEVADITPYKAYMQHFNNIGWAKKLDFGRNYFQLTETCSQALASAATAFYIRFAAKDKTGAGIHFAVCAAMGFSIAMADLFIFFADGGFRNSLQNVPSWLTGWSNWEYWTGFLTGLFIGIILVVYISHHPSDDKMTPLSPIPQNQPVIFIKNLILLAFPAVVSVAVPMAQRLTYKNDFFFKNVQFKNDEILVVPFIVLFIILLIFPALKLTKLELSGENELLFRIAPLWLVGSFVIFSILYFCTGNAYFLNGSKTDITITMYISTALIALLVFRLKLLHRSRTTP